jgi:hypothetical protein
MAKAKPSVSKLLAMAYAIGYGDAQRATMLYWEHPTLPSVRRYVARKTTVVKALMHDPKPLELAWRKAKQ